MSIQNYEFKAKIEATKPYEDKLLSLNPDYKGLDHQIDTYFKAKAGRLKLREGTIENALIDYDREDIQGAKAAKIMLYEHKPDQALKDILTKQFGIKVIVDKKRKIYYVDNVKFHFDEVKTLGTFMEVEAISENNEKSIDALKAQCKHYTDFFGLTADNMVSKSYSDLVKEASVQNRFLDDQTIEDITEEVSVGMNVYIHEKSGEILVIPDEDPDELISTVGEDAFAESWGGSFKKLDENPEAYLQIRPWTSHQAFDIMADFADQLPKEYRPLKIRLMEALERQKPFRNFKNIVEGSKLREDWFAFRHEQEKELIKKELRSLNLIE